MIEKHAVATFAGGCFWCMVEPFDERPGVIRVISGYTGGKISNPTYEQVATNTTGHREAVQITFNPEKLSYQELLNIFWQQIDPTDPGGQFNDRGESYQTAIFYHNHTQKELAEKSKERLQKDGKFSRPIVTEILPATAFYPAEKEHQHYYKSNPIHYQLYKKGSGRASFIKQNWETNNKKENLTRKLTPMQYHVTQEDGTEPPFQNEYWDHEEEGIYVDIVSGEALFSSKEKYDAHCGWPSFYKSIEENQIVEKMDMSHGMVRKEVRSKEGDSHLGHVFPDGPPEHGGIRYCINSAALKFIPKDKLAEEGYGEYLKLFE